MVISDFFIRIGVTQAYEIGCINDEVIKEEFTDSSSGQKRKLSMLKSQTLLRAIGFYLHHADTFLSTDHIDFAKFIEGGQSTVSLAPTLSMSPHSVSHHPNSVNVPATIETPHILPTPVHVSSPISPVSAPIPQPSPQLPHMFMPSYGCF